MRLRNLSCRNFFARTLFSLCLFCEWVTVFSLGSNGSIKETCDLSSSVACLFLVLCFFEFFYFATVCKFAFAIFVMESAKREIFL